MTAEVSPESVLLAEVATAFASSVAENPADDGFFGPGSVTWRVSADIALNVGGLRALFLQALHPVAMAGVDQHSDWRADPARRLANTSGYLAAITYGDRATARRAADRVKRVHEMVRGTDPVTGRAYAASDPDLLLWVHAALVDSNLDAVARYGTPLSAADQDRYVAEMVAAAELVGIPAGMVPETRADLDEYMAAVRPCLRLTDAAASQMPLLLTVPEAIDDGLAELWRGVADAAIASLPDWAREMYMFTEKTAPDRAEVRQVLGLLDAVYLGEPGVLEARQRIELRMRRAGR